MNTCARCEFFRCFHGEQQGHCYGTPPAAFSGGFQQTNPVTVKLSRPACSLFNALPEASPTLEHGKASPETPGDAMKQKRLEQVKQNLRSGKK